MNDVGQRQDHRTHVHTTPFDTDMRQEELAGFTTGLDLHGYVLAEDREAYKALLTRKLVNAEASVRIVRAPVSDAPEFIYARLIDV